MSKPDSRTPLRVVLTGPESTGKTTLARRLAERFGALWVPEFARAYLDLINAARPPGVVCEESDLLPILAGQVATEEAFAAQAPRLVLCDTDPLTTLVYAEHYFGRCPGAVRAAVASRRYELSLLLEVDVPWVADPQRDRPGARAEMLALFRSALERYERPYVSIGGDWKARERSAAGHVARLLQG